MTDREVRAELQTIAKPADQVLRTTEERAKRRAGMPQAYRLAVVVPLGYLVLCAVFRAAGFDFGWPLWVIGLLAVALPIAWYRLRPIEVAVPESASLALVDDTVGLQDRLTAAREFVDADESSPFMQAAIADAQAHFDAARRFAAEPDSTPARAGWREAGWVAVAAALLVASGWIGVRAPGTDAPIAERDFIAQRSDVGRESERPDTVRKPPRSTDKPRKPEERREPGAEAQKRGDSGVTDKHRKKSRGDQGVGKSSQAQSSSGQSTGEGQATDQAQPTKAATKKKPKPKKHKPQEDRPRKQQKKRPQADRESMASAGQGRGRGSTRSPTASEWSSKDQSVAEDDEELEDDADVDDEDEESEARGGLQPSLRQRKPPVNRDLSIGFGGGKPPPHANGRGGPGLPKKQRGVAQLVLGVPYPDQITGQPNPGRTKVTQERIEPQPQRADAVDAQARRARSTPLGHLAKPVLLPWMQDLLRNFQEALQKQRESNSGER